MNLKLVVASMSLLGLVSCPVFAATDSNDMNTKASKYSTTQTKVYHKKPHHKIVKQTTVQDEYKEVVSLPVQPAPVEMICTISESSLVLDAATQNVGRAIPNPCTPGWFNRISVSGGMNVDLGKWGNRNTNLMGENYKRLSLNDVYLNVTANINDWARAFASISYNTATINDPILSNTTTHYAEYDAAYSNNVLTGSSNALQIEQAFLTVGNFEVSPVYFQAGKQFQDFSRYEIHPITESLTQVMSKTLATSAKLGFIASGFNGSVFIFDDPISKVGQSSNTTNYGVSLGFDMPTEQYGLSVGAAWLYNLMGVNDIAYNVNQFNQNNAALGTTGGYTSRKSGAAAYADFNTGPFYIGARYTTALQRFNVNDLPSNGIADIVAGTGAPIADADGARPWSAGLQAGYGFSCWDKTQNITIGYQTSREAAGLNMPKHRWLGSYNIDAWKNTNFAIEWDHDTAYNVAHGGSGKVSNLVSLRAAVKFA
ncbi:MAG: LbtU family siderophore porin [Gammaproteobacteria bacterium]|nr:LbtU family siderophore porin [Gammaproteobacteria bacterium]